ncbi:AMP-dependent synthetase/ligase [Geopsychrobacter electrodiphilus]|uniref:AMP-dependent synthetase/ligase n=1 Tax=Geopsychrobacter electrodiphilus TaxID=225196 RepID=UPI00037EA370|nr:AMP-binding protein [Geopsychrobacter electrodiphilus]
MQTIDHIIASSCLQNPDRCALQYKQNNIWTETSFESLWTKTEAIAAGLRASGVAPGDHVALLAPSSPHWIACYLGVLRNSGIAIPIDKELKSAELRHILADSDAKLVFVGGQQLETLLEIVDDLPNLKQIILIDIDPRQQTGQSSINGLLSEVSGALKTLSTEPGLTADKQNLVIALNHKLLLEIGPDPKNQKEKANILGINEDMYRHLRDIHRLQYLNELKSDVSLPPARHNALDCAVILYTSGTTGRSKGAMLSHSNIVSNIKATARQFKLDSSIHTLSFLPINHVFEQVCGVLLPLSLGGKVTFAESIKKLGDNLHEIKPSFLLGVPAVYRLLFDRIMKNINSKKLSRLLFSLPLGRKIVTGKIQKVFGKTTIFVSGGAALDPAIALGFKELGLTLLQGYGITETSPVIAAETPDCLRAGSVGLPLENVEIRIDNPDAEGAGEIQVRGPNVMLGYYKNELATQEVLQDNWYRTGDLGTIASDGTLTICGRVKNLIVTPNGKNVYPEEIENQLANSPFIAEIMVYGHKVSSTAEEVYASIFPNEEALFEYQQQLGKGPLSPVEVETLIRKEVLKYGNELSDYKRVKKFNLREDEFPKTTTRKIKRFAIEPTISTEE